MWVEEIECDSVMCHDVIWFKLIASAISGDLGYGVADADLQAQRAFKSLLIVFIVDFSICVATVFLFF